MKISGFTVIRNAEIMGYPILPSIKSLLPLVDEFVIGVGQSDDNTRQLIESIGDSKIKVFDSHWDLESTTGGLILSEKTNEALAKCENDWCFYLQADEVLHEEDYNSFRESFKRANDNPSVEGLLFDYVHFYGSYHTIGTSRQWYRREIRAIRKSSGAQSFRDAQGFRIGENHQKLKVIPAGGRVFHYGWVKPPKQMGRKARMLDFWWHGERENRDDEFSYDNKWGLKQFAATHPALMLEMVKEQDWEFVPRRTLKDWRFKDLRLVFSDVIEKVFKYRIGEYKPYRLTKL